MSSRLAQASFPSLLSGPIVKILWGVDQRTATIPAALLRSCCSPSLDASLKQVWIDQQDGAINWQELDGPTVERFLTWLYRDDYNAPDPQLCSPADCHCPRYQRTSDQENDINTTGAGGNPGTEPDAASEPADESILEPEQDEPEPAPEQDLDNLQETEQEVGQQPFAWPQEESLVMQHIITESWDVRPLTPINSCLAIGLPEEQQDREAGIFAQGLFPYSDHHYKEVLLTHANLYTFALYHQIKGLQDLSLQRLTQVLMNIDCQQPHAASEIAVLIQHVYRNTLPSTYSKDAARQLVSQFVAINFDELDRGEIEILLEDGGDFVLDTSRKVARHLRSARNKALLTEEHVVELESEIQRLKKAARDQGCELEPTAAWRSYGTTGKKKARK